MTMTESVEQVAEKLGLFARVGLFYRQVVSELRKVVWPTRNQLTTYTAVVLVFVFSSLLLYPSSTLLLEDLSSGYLDKGKQ
jgi:preprotein translocase SecE subunit